MFLPQSMSMKVVQLERDLNYSFPPPIPSSHAFTGPKKGGKKLGCGGRWRLFKIPSSPSFPLFWCLVITRGGGRLYNNCSHFLLSEATAVQIGHAWISLLLPSKRKGGEEEISVAKKTEEGKDAFSCQFRKVWDGGKDRTAGKGRKRDRRNCGISHEPVQKREDGRRRTIKSSK